MKPSKLFMAGIIYFSVNVISASLIENPKELLTSVIYQTTYLIYLLFVMMLYWAVFGWEKKE